MQLIVIIPDWASSSKDKGPGPPTIFVTLGINVLSSSAAVSYTHLDVYKRQAHKHVPLMEDNVQEAVKTNIFGTYNVASASALCGAKKFVMISTDKAVNPTSVMGATKRVAEMIVQSMNLLNSGTQFVSVRFGNVLGSRGSVVPEMCIRDRTRASITSKRCACASKG